MNIKGKDLIAMWNKANAVVSPINRLGEIGGIVRKAGYDVLYDGFSVCDFFEKGLWLKYVADNCDTAPRWRLANSIKMSGRVFLVANIAPEADYKIEQMHLKSESKI